MERAIELAGFFAAHGIWCVAEGEPLTPMVAQESAALGATYCGLRLTNSKKAWPRHRNTWTRTRARPSVGQGRVIALPSGRTDALIILVRSYARPAVSSTTLTMAVPYRNAQSPDGFAVHRPKFMGWQGPGTADYQVLGDAFFRGVESHEAAAPVWAQHNDDSI